MLFTAPWASVTIQLGDPTRRPVPLSVRAAAVIVNSRATGTSIPSTVRNTPRPPGRSIWAATTKTATSRIRTHRPESMTSPPIDAKVRSMVASIGSIGSKRMASWTRNRVSRQQKLAIPKQMVARALEMLASPASPGGFMNPLAEPFHRHAGRSPTAAARRAAWVRVNVEDWAAAGAAATIRIPGTSITARPTGPPLLRRRQRSAAAHTAAAHPARSRSKPLTSPSSRGGGSGR